jgi:hypothetical protein
MRTAGPGSSFILLWPIRRRSTFRLRATPRPMHSWVREAGAWETSTPKGRDLLTPRRGAVPFSEERPWPSAAISAWRCH